MSYLDRRHYHLLLQISLHGHLGRSASFLGLHQPAASHQLREAERRLGIKLVQRSGRSIKLTDAASRLVETAGQTETLLEKAESDAIWFDRGKISSIRFAIGAFDDLHWLPDVAKTLEKVHQNLHLEVLRYPHDQVSNAIISGTADVALLPTDEQKPGFITLPVMSEQSVGVFSKNAVSEQSLVKAEDFTDQRYLTYQLRAEPNSEYHLFFRPSGQFPKQVQRIESISAILEMVSAESCRTILSITMKEHKSINKISEETKIPISTIYRRIQMLHDEKLMRVLGMIDENGKKSFLYKSKIKSISTFFNGDFIEIEIVPNIIEKSQDR